MRICYDSAIFSSVLARVDKQSRAMDDATEHCTHMPAWMDAVYGILGMQIAAISYLK